MHLIPRQKFAQPHCNLATLLVAAALVLSSSPSQAAGADKSVAKSAQVDRLNEAGAGHYARREYRQAIALFSKALAIDPDPNLLFNIARCHERLGETQAAIDNYELFVSTPGADAQGRARAQTALAALRKSQEPPTSVAPPAVAPSTTAPTVATTVASPSAGPSSAVSWATLGGGAALVLAGATFYGLGSSDHRKVTKADGFGEDGEVVDMSLARAEKLVESGDRKKLFGGLGLGVGAALVATYIVLVSTDDSSSEPTDVAFSILPSTEGAAVTFQGSF